MVGTCERIGIPRSILHLEFDGAIERFLRRLGIDVALSPPTNAEIFQAGKRVVIDELCFPIKIFVGHVVHLANQAIDRILIPAVVGHVNHRAFPCHPRQRLPDIVRALGICDADRLLTPAFRYDRHGLTLNGFRSLAQALGASGAAASQALQTLESERHDTGGCVNHDRLTVAIVGHPYVVEDPWANNHVIQRIERLGCRVVTRIDHRPTAYAPDNSGLHFSLAARTVALTQAFDQEETIDGIVFLLPFNCGPDGDIASHLARTTTKPFLTLVLDELQSSAGLVTRLEAFIDLLQGAPILVGGRST